MTADMPDTPNTPDTPQTPDQARTCAAVPTSASASDPTAAPLRYAYGTPHRAHLHHPHLFCSDVDATIAFYRDWFGAEVRYDGPYADTRNVFLKIGTGAMHLCKIVFRWRHFLVKRLSTHPGGGHNLGERAVFRESEVDLR